MTAAKPLAKKPDKKTGRGGQTVLVMEASKGRHRLVAFIHRHKKHNKLHSAGGANEAMHVLQMLRKMTRGQAEDVDDDACHGGQAFIELYTPDRMWHITADNYFYAHEVPEEVAKIPGAGWLSTVPRGRVKWKAHEVHKVSISSSSGSDCKL